MQITPGVCTVDESQVRAVIKQSVDEAVQNAVPAAVKQTLLTIGLNVQDPDSVIEQQRDFSFIRTMRRGVGAAILAWVAGRGSAVYAVYHWAMTWGHTPPPHG